MPKLTYEFREEVLKMMRDRFMQKHIEYQKWQFYNGSTRDIILEAVRKEFKNPNTVSELEKRLFPLNIMKKIINKTSKVYAEQPVRSTVGKDDDDDEMIKLLEDSFKVSLKMPTANKVYNIYKKNLFEPFVDKDGIPRLRSLPPFTYHAFSFDNLCKEIPDLIVKVVNNSHDDEKMVLAWYTSEEFVLTNGKNDVLTDRMQAMKNKDGINPYGVLPFVYTVNSDISTEPIPEDDLFAVSVAIPIILSDLSFGSKYQAWSLIWTIGMNGDLPTGPNSVVHLKRDADGNPPSINQVKPNLSIDETLRLVERVVDYLLWTHNLQAGSVSGQLNAQNAASGISKAIDNSDLSEDKKMQQAIFREAEKELWTKTALNLYPVWMKQGVLSQKFRKAFSADFEPSIIMQEPKVVMSEKEKIENSKLKLASPALSTRARELANIYPSMGPEELQQLEKEITEENSENIIIEESTPDGEQG